MFVGSNIALLHYKSVFQLYKNSAVDLRYYFSTVIIIFTNKSYPDSDSFIHFYWQHLGPQYFSQSESQKHTLNDVVTTFFTLFFYQITPSPIINA